MGIESVEWSHYCSCFQGFLHLLVLGKKEGYHLRKEKNLSIGCIQQTIPRLCCCVHVSCPLAVGRYILSAFDVS